MYIPLSLLLIFPVLHARNRMFAIFWASKPVFFASAFVETPFFVFFIMLITLSVAVSLFLFTGAFFTAAFLVALGLGDAFPAIFFVVFGFGAAFFTFFALTA